MNKEAGKRRLVLCLDGTWNKQDDNTNVIHLYNLVREGVADDGKEQKRYYDLGVGTGVLDGISGGAFGLGLEENVREAMNWLIANYDDGDEIFIFGFSRGSYTARSLVGFISKCGIPRRGAPLTVNELWEGYCILGRQDEHRLNWWEQLVGTREAPFQSIDKYQPDVWRASLPPEDWRSNYKTDFIPVDRLNDTEKLINEWSRRPQITCLGIYDTVGSMGAEALAIPGLRGTLAAHHNMRLHSIVGHAFHGLALDENRSTFSLTPLSEWVDAEKNSKVPDDVIKQRWFVGAHSNIGGGYEDNILAQIPLQWMMEQSGKLGLEFLPNTILGRELDPNHPAVLVSLKDSYAEFASPLWTHVLRGKRNYRTMAPEAESFGPAGTATQGYSMRDVGSELDASVELIVAGDAAAKQNYAPANLVAYAKREKLPSAALLENRCRHLWPAAPVSANIWLIFWAFTAAAGLTCVPHIFALGWSDRTIAWLAPFTAFLAVLVDWSESRMVHRSALSPQDGYKLACVDVLYWIRAIAVVLFLIGLPYVVWSVLCMVWKLDCRACLTGQFWHRGLGGMIGSLFAAFGRLALSPWAQQGFWSHWQAALLSSAIPAKLLRTKTGALPPAVAKKKQDSKVAFFVGVACAMVGFMILQAAVRLIWDVTRLAEWPGFPGLSHEVASPSGGGALLLIEIAFLGFLHSYNNWVGQPLSRRHLSSIFGLQICCKPSAVQAQLGKWSTALLRKVLRRPADAEGRPGMLLVGESLPEGGTEAEQQARAAAKRMKEALCETLWRDSLGFVPLYSIVIMLGLWYAKKFLGCKCAICGPWFLLPLLTAVFDWGENAIHGFIYRPAFEKDVKLLEGDKGKGAVIGGEPPSGWVLLASICTWSKMVGFAMGMSVTFLGIVNGGWQVLQGAGSGWRGALALLLWGVILIGALVHGIIAIKHLKRWVKAH